MSVPKTPNTIGLMVWVDVAEDVVTILLTED